MKDTIVRVDALGELEQLAERFASAFEHRTGMPPAGPPPWASDASAAASSFAASIVENSTGRGAITAPPVATIAEIGAVRAPEASMRRPTVTVSVSTRRRVRRPERFQREAGGAAAGGRAPGRSGMGVPVFPGYNNPYGAETPGRKPLRTETVRVGGKAPPHERGSSRGEVGHARR